MSFNWNEIPTPDETKNSSDTATSGGGNIYIYRVPERGILNSRSLTASFDSIGLNINQQWSLWNTYIKPLLDSLPAGIRDQRWLTSTGLPYKADALTYGIQGSTILVCNDATSSFASGKYWDTSSERPKTIIEAFEDVWDAINGISLETSTESSDLTNVWAAIGNRYQDSSLPSLSTSLDFRTGLLEENINQLTNDIYGVDEGFGYGFGSPLDYSIAKNIDVILKIHGITSGWQADPSGATHGAVTPGPHEHPYSDIKPPPSASLTQNRVGAVTSLENDVKRLRYEIGLAKGTSWYTDPTNPTEIGGVASIHTHVNFVGSGTPSSTNPHGVYYTDTGANICLSNLADYVGMPDYTFSNMPLYTSNNYISDGDSLLTAISTLDHELNTGLSSLVTRREDIIDLEAYVPYTLTHNRGKKPIIQVLTESGYTPVIDIEIEHLSDNAFLLEASENITVQVIQIY